MEFELLPNRTLRYANNSNYKNDVMIRKEGFFLAIFVLQFLNAFVLLVSVSQSVVDEIKRIILDSEITREDDRNWPEPDREGRQELEVKMGSEHIHFTVS